MPVVDWRETAREDLLAIVTYIMDDNIEAAQRLKDDIEKNVAELIHNPRMYKRGRVAGTREMIVRTNYIVVYTENSEKISILRVLHAARNWPWV
ncbi:MAG: type II toxin-antitoxin system RelE/ParE family toxin [Desulfovibrio sp.]|jgi:addiction module RelE/StbE family toxin|nr:type II toxin-antitoxin system RelE/ParE family toxin [Desulfovibrio sp.]